MMQCSVPTRRWQHNSSIQNSERITEFDWLWWKIIKKNINIFFSFILILKFTWHNQKWKMHNQNAGWNVILQYYIYPPILLTWSKLSFHLSGNSKIIVLFVIWENKDVEMFCGNNGFLTVTTWKWRKRLPPLDGSITVDIWTWMIQGSCLCSDADQVGCVWVGIKGKRYTAGILNMR